MFGRNSHTPKPKKPFQLRPVRNTTRDEVFTPIPELGTHEPYYESYFWWINPENTVTLQEITALYQYDYGENFTYKTPSEKSTSIWYTQYPESNQSSSQCFEIPIVWGGNKR